MLFGVRYAMSGHRFNHGRTQRSSTARGYDARHRAWIKANKPLWIGRRCPGKGPTSGRCRTILVEHRTNYRTGRQEAGMHADHAGIPASQGGLPTGYLCPECNREDGARRGNRRQARRHPELHRKTERVVPLSL